MVGREGGGLAERPLDGTLVRLAMTSSATTSRSPDSERGGEVERVFGDIGGEQEDGAGLVEGAGVVRIFMAVASAADWEGGDDPEGLWSRGPLVCG